MLKTTRIFRFSKGNGLLLSLTSSHEAIYTKTPVKHVTLPGCDGYFTLTSGHSPLVSRLKPGVISVVKEDSNDTTKYFISSGFLSYKKNDDNNVANVTGVEIVPLDQIDKERTTAVLQEVLAESQNNPNPWSKIKSFLAQDLCSSILKAVQ